MGNRTSLGNEQYAVNKYIGTAYDHVKNVSENIEDVKIVADALGDDFPEDGLDTIVENIDSINTVEDDISSINTVADNILEVVEVADNIDAVLDAPNQAELAYKWAQEAEDVEVLPSEYSAYHYSKKSEEQAVIATDAADSIGRYQGLWPDSGGSATKGDTYQTQVSGTPTGQYFTALQDTAVDPAGDDVNWREVVSVVDVNARDSLVAGGGINNAVLSVGVQSTVVPVNKSIIKVATGNGDSGVELLYLWRESGDFPSSARTVTNIIANTYSGYTVTADGVDYEFVNGSTYRLRGGVVGSDITLEAYPQGWGAGEGIDCQPAFQRMASESLNHAIVNLGYKYLLDARANEEWGYSPRTLTTVKGYGHPTLKMMPLDGRVTARILDLNRVQFVTVEGLRIEGERDEHTGSGSEFCHGVRIYNRCRNITLRDVVSYNCEGDGFVIGNDAIGPTNIQNSFIEFDNCFADNNKRQGLSITDCSDALFIGCRFENTNGTDPECGVDCEPNVDQSVRRCRFIQCRFTGNANSGLLIDGNNGPVEDIVCQDSYFINNAQGVESIGNLNGLTVRGGEITRSSSRGLSLFNANGSNNDILIDGVTFKDNTAFDFYCDNSVSKLKVVNCTIAGLTSGSNYSVSMRNVENAVISQNSFSGKLSFEMISCGRNVISDNQFTDCVGVAMIMRSAGSTYNLITNNTFTSCGTNENDDVETFGSPVVFRDGGSYNVCKTNFFNGTAPNEAFYTFKDTSTVQNKALYDMYELNSLTKARYLDNSLVNELCEVVDTDSLFAYPWA